MTDDLAPVGVPDEPEPKPRALPPGTHESMAIPVAMRDVLPWTKPGCKSCDGRGVIALHAAPQKHKPVPKAERKFRTKLCGCAIKRFRKAQESTVINGQLFAVEPWVAVHPETVAEVVEAMEKEEAAKVAAAAEPPREMIVNGGPQ